VDLEHLRYGGGPNETLLHPAVLAAMIIAILANGFLLPRNTWLYLFSCAPFSFLPGRGFTSAGLHIFASANYPRVSWMRLAYEKFTSGRKLIFGRLYFHRYGVNALGTLS